MFINSFWSLFLLFYFFKDGTEQRIVESLSLIDAVMPDVVASRQQQNQQKPLLKNEPHDTNGDEGKGN